VKKVRRVGNLFGDHADSVRHETLRFHDFGAVRYRLIKNVKGWAVETHGLWLTEEKTREAQRLRRALFPTRSKIPGSRGRQLGWQEKVAEAPVRGREVSQKSARAEVGGETR
jgi:hypothetical protein